MSHCYIILLISQLLHSICFMTNNQPVIITPYFMNQYDFYGKWKLNSSLADTQLVSIFQKKNKCSYQSLLQSLECSAEI